MEVLKMQKAKYLSTYYFQHRKHLEYEYRGEKYSVCAEWNAEPLAWQHKSEQSLINSRLDTKCKSTESAEVGFELFWESVEG
jgi:hypothetical protein